jgi:hypothetical protein
MGPAKARREAARKTATSAGIPPTTTHGNRVPVLVKVREWISSALASPDLVLEA